MTCRILLKIFNDSNKAKICFSDNEIMVSVNAKSSITCLFDITKKATFAVYDVDDVLIIIAYDDLIIDVTSNVVR